jgi:hypothetical protein
MPVKVGDRYGLLTVLRYTGHRKHGNGLWAVACDCGKVKFVWSQNLKSKTGTRSCGCLKRAAALKGWEKRRGRD